MARGLWRFLWGAQAGMETRWGFQSSGGPTASQLISPPVKWEPGSLSSHGWSRPHETQDSTSNEASFPFWRV